MNVRKKVYIKGLFCFLIGVLIGGTVFSQTNGITGHIVEDTHFPYNRMDESIGTKTGVFNCVTRDSRGFMWFGTFTGLYRYDGYASKAFHYEPGNRNSLSAEAVEEVIESTDGRLWMATRGGGVSVFDRKTEEFIAYMHDDDDDEENSLIHNQVNALLEDPAGNIWAGTDAGLDRINPSTGEITHVFFESDANMVQKLFMDDEGSLWIGTLGRGMIRFNPVSGTRDYYRHIPDQPNSLSHNNVAEIVMASDGGMWIGTDDGLDYFDPETGEFTHYRQSAGESEGAEYNGITCLKVDNNRIWVGTAGSGLFLFDQKEKTFSHVEIENLSEDRYRNTTVSDLYRDPANMLWVTTREGGVSLLDLNKPEFEVFQKVPGDPDSLSSSATWPILEDSRGTIWIGTIGGGLNRLEKEADGQFIHYMHDPNDPGSLPHNEVYSLAEDKSGKIWVGTRKGVSLLDPNTGKFADYVKESGDLESVHDDWISALYPDSRGDMWIGTLGKGLYRVALSSGHIDHFMSDAAAPRRLSGDRIVAITEHESGVIWLTTLSSGINRIDPETGEITTFRHDRDDPDSISSDQTGQVFFDSNGTMWCTTAGGLDKYNSDRGNFDHYRTEDGLPSNNIVAIVEERPGILWLATFSDGISRFDTKNGTFHNLDRRDGLPGNEYRANGLLLSRDGKIYFAGMNGVVAFHPAQILTNTAPPPVVLTDFLIFNQPVQIGGKDSLLNTSINETEHIELHQSHSMISFEFAALNYRSPRKNQYAYMLEGFDSEWNYVDSSRRFATYTNLDPGSYTFRVIASNNDGVWNRTGREISMHISPYWWNTWWFIILSSLVVMGTVGLFFRSRILLLREKVRSAEVLKESEARYRELAESISDVFFAIDKEHRYTYWNKAAEKLTGFPAEKVIGKRMGDLYPEGSTRHQIAADYRKHLEIQKHHSFRHSLPLKGREHVLESNLYPSEGEGISVIIKDISDQVEAENKIRKALAEKETLLRELYHRTRNTMQIIQSMMMLQVGAMHDEKMEEMAQNLTGKIEAMALVHEMLYESGDLSKIDLREYIRSLTIFILQSYEVAPGRINLKVGGKHLPILLDSAIPCGLVINELMSNSVKHAFPQNRKGTITIRVEKVRDGKIRIDYADNGVGIPEGLDLNNHDSIGIEIIRSLVEDQLKGEIHFSYEEGTKCTFTMSVNLYGNRV